MANRLFCQLPHPQRSQQWLCMETMSSHSYWCFDGGMGVVVHQLEIFKPKVSNFFLISMNEPMKTVIWVGFMEPSGLIGISPTAVDQSTKLMRLFAPSANNQTVADTLSVPGTQESSISWPCLPVMLFFSSMWLRAG